MKHLKNNIRSELIKNKRGIFFPIHVVAPMFAAALILEYFYVRQFSLQEQFVNYYVLMQAAFPFMISLVVNLIFKKEEENNFFNMLSAVNRESAVLAKLLLLNGMGMMAELILMGLFEVIVGKAASIKCLIGIFSIVMFSNIIIYIFHSFLFLCFGSSINLLAGICETVMSMVFLTGLGDGIWKFMPFAMGARGANVLYFIDQPYTKKIMELRTVLQNEITTLPFIIVVELILAHLLFFGWLKRWEGRKTFE